MGIRLRGAGAAKRVGPGRGGRVGWVLASVSELKLVAPERLGAVVAEPRPVEADPDEHDAGVTRAFSPIGIPLEVGVQTAVSLGAGEDVSLSFALERDLVLLSNHQRDSRKRTQVRSLP